MADNPHISPNCSIEAAAAGALCNVFGLHEYDNRTSFFGGNPQFPQVRDLGLTRMDADYSTSVTALLVSPGSVVFACTLLS